MPGLPSGTGKTSDQTLAPRSPAAPVRLTSPPSESSQVSPRGDNPSSLQDVPVDGESLRLTQLRHQAVAAVLSQQSDFPLFVQNVTRIKARIMGGGLTALRANVACCEAVQLFCRRLKLRFFVVRD